MKIRTVDQLSSHLDAKRFHTLVEEILEMLRWFRTDIENAAAQKAFLAPIPCRVSAADAPLPIRRVSPPPPT